MRRLRRARSSAIFGSHWLRRNRRAIVALPSQMADSGDYRPASRSPLFSERQPDQRPPTLLPDAIDCKQVVSMVVPTAGGQLHHTRTITMAAAGAACSPRTEDWNRRRLVFDARFRRSIQPKSQQRGRHDSDHTTGVGDVIPSDSAGAPSSADKLSRRPVRQRSPSEAWMSAGSVRGLRAWLMDSIR